MEIIGPDLHTREGQRVINADDGTSTDRRIATSRERCTAVLGARPRARILLGASTESEWVARHPETRGHAVLVADPNDAPMYATRSRRSKTDTRDARTLMDAGETGAYRPAYRRSEARRHVRAERAVRDALVRTRTRYLARAKALVRRDGLRVPTSARAWVPTRIVRRAAASAAGEDRRQTRGIAGQHRARIEWTESGAASARNSWTRDAPHRSRWIVGAVRSFVPPTCAGTIASRTTARTAG